MTNHHAPNAAVALGLMERWGARPWAKQTEIVRAVFGGRRTTIVTSATGTGKTHIGAQCGWAWLLSASDRRLFTTAPTARQVNGALWVEMRAIAAGAAARGLPMGGQLAPKAARWDMRPGWDAQGFTAGREAGGAGLHSSGGTLVILDDAQGVDDDVWDTLAGTLTGENDRMLVLGNPVRNRGRFFEFSKTRGGAWVNRLTISAFETPNLLEGRTVIPGMQTKQSVDEKREIWGEDSPLWKSRILGVFPESDERALVPIDWVDMSNREWLATKPQLVAERPEYITMGCDVAGLGKDFGVTALAYDFALRDTARGIPYKARFVAQLTPHPKLETMATTGYLINEHKRVRPNSFRLDKAGMGIGIYDRLRELGVPVVGLNGGDDANDKTRFFNARSEWHYGLREALRPRTDGFVDKRPHVLLPPNDKLWHQITTIMVDADSSGRIKLEPKLEWKARNQGSSPDELDALAMTMCDEPREGGTSIGKWMAAYGKS